MSRGVNPGPRRERIGRKEAEGRRAPGTPLKKSIRGDKMWGEEPYLMHLRSITFHPEQYPTADRYPFNLSLLRETGTIVFDSPVSLFCGENGTGKSTVLEALAHKCEIHIWRDTERTRFRYNPYEDKLARYVSVEWVDGTVPGSFFGSSVFQDFARILDEWASASPALLDYFGGSSLLTQSHGQSIMSFFRSR